jgi:hypothetical protein
MSISEAIKWLLFLALFPMSFIWLRRAWRIFIKQDYAEVALKRGEAPLNPKKWAPVTGMLNLVAGTIAATIILSIPVFVATGFSLFSLYEYDSWSATIGVTLWMKIFADFIISSQAHPFVLGRKKEKEKEKE